MFNALQIDVILLLLGNKKQNRVKQLHNISFCTFSIKIAMLSHLEKKLWQFA